MTNAALPATALGRLGAFPGPVIAVIDPMESGAHFTPATSIEPRPSADGLQALQARREELAARLARLQRQGRSREASACSAELRAVTTEIMIMGGRDA
jgi:hypothetical protein